MSSYNFNTPEEMRRRDNISHFLEGTSRATSPMSSYNFNSQEEMRRSNNISQFIEGLLEDEGNLRSNVTTQRNVKQEENCRQKLAVKSETISVSNKPVFFQARLLPDCELLVLHKHSTLFKLNRDNLFRIPFSIHCIKHSDKLVEIYTGIPLVKGFFKLANMFRKNEITYRHGWVVGQLTMKQQLLLTLMKLKLGMSDVDLSHRFNCSLETVNNTVETWIFTIHAKLFDIAVGLLRQIRPPAQSSKPLIVHTFTVNQEVPHNPLVPHKTPLEPYTAVLLTKPDGVVIYASSLYTWTGNKRDVIHRSGVLDVLMPGECIIVDSDVRQSLAIPQTVVANQIGMGNFGLLATKTDLERRLKEYEAVRCIPSGLEEHSSVIWQTVVTLTNFTKFKTFMF